MPSWHSLCYCVDTIGTFIQFLSERQFSNTRTILLILFLSSDGLGQSVRSFLQGIVSLYPLGVRLVGNLLDLHHPCWHSMTFGDQDICFFFITIMATSKTTSIQNRYIYSAEAYDEQENDEYSPHLITLEAKLNLPETHNEPLTKVSLFVIQMGLQGIIGIPKFFKTFKSIFYLKLPKSTIQNLFQNLEWYFGYWEIDTELIVQWQQCQILG